MPTTKFTAQLAAMSDYQLASLALSVADDLEDHISRRDTYHQCDATRRRLRGILHEIHDRTCMPRLVNVNSRLEGDGL